MRRSAPDDPPRPARALWPLALLAGLLPLAATVVAFVLAVRAGLVPACNPFVEGCVSISRTARHGLPNILFRGLVLPAAALQALCWMLCPGWLRSLGAAPGRWERAVPVAGVVAAAFLVLYGTFLGTEGEGYRWMRRYGVIFYFGLTGIATLLVSGQMQRLAACRGHGRAAVALCMLLPALGLAHVFMPLVWDGPAAKNALENVTEWWGAAIFTAFFGVLASAWRSTGLAFHLRSATA